MIYVFLNKNWDILADARRIRIGHALWAMGVALKGSIGGNLEEPKPQPSASN